MTKRSEQEIAALLDEVGAEYAEEERESVEEAALLTRHGVLEVTLGPELYESVRQRASSEQNTPQVLVRRWVAERAAAEAGDDPDAAVADLRRDVERVAKLMRPA